MAARQQSSIRIGCSSAFWGDSALGAFQLVKEAPNLNYLVADYLAEVTMGILARVKEKAEQKGEQGGYVKEFCTRVFAPLLSDLCKKNIRVVTNAGGMNPLACKAELEAIARENGQSLVVAAITGDDLLSSAQQLREANQLSKFEFGGEEEEIFVGSPKKKLMSFNAYIGARAIATALEKGAQVVITGRVVDSALVLGPLMHEFQWSPSSFDLLAAGSLAGHIIECGCQATGGNFTDWRDSVHSGAGGWTNMGFPFVDCFPDGSFLVSKPPNTGGLVTVGTVGEQMLYEIGDPAAYILPDVVLDLRAVEITQEGKDVVRVSGVRGRAPPDEYKISATHVNGYSVSANLMIGGMDAREKASEIAKAVLARASFLLKKRGLPDFLGTNVELLGSEHTYGPHSKVSETREVILRISVHHESMLALYLFGSEVAPTATSMAPGITGGGDGRPRARPLLAHTACLVHKSAVPVHIHVGDQAPISSVYVRPSWDGGDSIPPAPLPRLPPHASDHPSGPFVELPLIALCLARSGDKGDVANIGVLCRQPLFFPLIRRVLTDEAVRNYLSHVIDGNVVRFVLPGTWSFNFLCTRSLGGGGLSSLRYDRQGKAYAQMLLSKPIQVPRAWLSLVSPTYTAKL